MDLTTGIVFGEDYYGDEVNELAVASFNYVKQDIADVKKRYMSLGFHLHEMEMRRTSSLESSIGSSSSCRSSSNFLRRLLL